MHAHDGVATQRANEAGFLAVVRAEVLVIFDATCERRKSTQRDAIQIASEVDPLATTARPGLAAKGLGDAGREERSFEFGEMFADHGFVRRSGYRNSIRSLSSSGATQNASSESDLINSLVVRAA